MKKIGLFLCLIVLFTTNMVYAFADNAEITIDSVTVKQGDSADIELYMTNCPDIKSFCLYDFVCDSPDVEVQSGSWKLKFSIIHDDLNLETNDAVIAFIKNTDCNGKIFKISVKVSQQAEPGIYSFSCSAVAKHSEDSGNEISVPITVKSATLEIVGADEKTRVDISSQSNSAESVLNDLDDNAVVSVFDKILLESNKSRVDNLNDEEIIIASEELIDKSEKEKLDAVLSMENKQTAFNERYFRAHCDIIINDILNDDNSHIIKDTVRGVLEEYEVVNISEIHDTQKSSFISDVLTNLEKQGIKDIDFPKSFDNDEKIAVIEALFEKTTMQVDNNSLIFVAVIICAFAVIAGITAIIKRKTKRT